MTGFRNVARTGFTLFAASFLILTSQAANIPSVPITTTNVPDVATDIKVDCNNDQIVVKVFTETGLFNGMIYPKGLSKNSSCLVEWVQQEAPITYKLPLRGCNTMSTELDDGGIEYYNTIVVQPHLKLVTNQGKGFHIRCKYATRNNTVPNDALRFEYLSSDDPVTQRMQAMPGCTMKIFNGDPTMKEVAANVKIGDPLTLQVSLDHQPTYGIRVTECLVRDGLGWGEQKLINLEGCPVDPDIMGRFEYTEEDTKATVHFQAHKFPYTASVYYQCNVKLCNKDKGACRKPVPSCGVGGSTSNNRLRKREAANVTEGTPATIEVFSGLYVNEANDLAKAGFEEDFVIAEKPEDAICISQKNFAIGICIAGLILMLCVIAAILCLLARRRNKKTSSNPSSSIYSGPYTNTAYSHSS